DTAGQGLQPIDQAMAHYLADKAPSMLGNDLLDLQRAHHMRPITQNLVRHHVAALKSHHQRNMRIEIRDWVVGIVSFDQGNPKVAGKQDFRNGVVELEIALGMQKMRGQRLERGAADTDIRTLVGYAD